MAEIFISFRTQDAQFAPPMLDNALCAEFGPDRVFRDKRALRPGTDFPPELLRRLESATVLLALIGPHWLDASDGNGRRIDNPDDYVRREVCSALERKIRVIPILLNDTPLPPKAELPDCVKPLADRQFMLLRQLHTEMDLTAIVTTLKNDIPSVRPPESRGGDVYHAEGVRSAVAAGPNSHATYNERDGRA